MEGELKVGTILISESGTKYTVKSLLGAGGQGEVYDVESGGSHYALKTNDPYEVFGSPDDMKLLSCMTLFEQADPENKVFPKVIEKFYHGRRDQKTLEILQNEIPPELGDRKIYDTPIGPACMSKIEHEAYMEERRIRESREKKC